MVVTSTGASASPLPSSPESSGLAGCSRETLSLEKLWEEHKSKFLKAVVLLGFFPFFFHLHVDKTHKQSSSPYVTKVS